MNYNARKHNPAIRKIFADFGQDTWNTYTDSRTYGSRISFQPAFYALDYKPLNYDGTRGLVTAVEQYLARNDITNVSVKTARSTANINGGYYNLRLNLYVTK